MPPPPYAPTPHSYVPNTALSATINLDEEVELTTTRAEHDLQDSLAELFSIIVTIDALERALFKDLVPEAEYTELCGRMLKQYRSILADEAVAAEFGDLESFKAKWEIEAPRATERIKVGVPLTRVDVSGRDDAQSPAVDDAAGGSAGSVAGPSTPAHASAPPAPTPAPADALSGKLILEATQDFITFLDGVKIGLLSKDQLHPLLTEVIQSVNKVTTSDFDCRGKIVQWLITLNQMKATDQLTDDQVRELSMDIHQAYQGFKSTLT